MESQVSESESIGRNIWKSRRSRNFIAHSHCASPSRRNRLTDNTCGYRISKYCCWRMVWVSISSTADEGDSWDCTCSRNGTARKYLGWAHCWRHCSGCVNCGNTVALETYSDTRCQGYDIAF